MRMLPALAALAVAGAALAQDTGDDWDLAEQRGAASASIAYDSGLAVVVRCDDQHLETYIVGLPVPDARETQRTISYAFGDRPMRESTWQASADGAALFADLPAALARRFRAGGDLQLLVPARGRSPARRYVITLPPSPAAVDRVLAACGRPAIDPRDPLRDSEASADIASRLGEPARWATQPRPRYPDDALVAGLSGMAVLSCLFNADGRLRECQVEVERPAKAGFGREALRAAERARLAPSAGMTGLTTFTVRFSVPGR